MKLHGTGTIICAQSNGGLRIAICVLGFLLAASAYANTYYASPNGSGDEGSAESPFSLSSGISKVKANSHTLILKPGRYLLSTAIAFNGTEEGIEPTRIIGETGDPADVILDAQGKSEVMRINKNVIVAGITMMNGSNKGFSSYDNRAAGVRVGWTTNPGTLSVVSNCVITCCTNAFTSSTTPSGSSLPVYGGAVGVFDTGLLVASRVTNNTAAYRSAGVVLVNGVVRDCTISGNSASSEGGGLFCERNTTNMVVSSEISSNSAVNGGGGVSCITPGVSLVLTNCTVAYNTATNGAGIEASSGSAKVTCLDCRFERNVAHESGGGVRITSKVNGFFDGCVFDGNSADNSANAHGGGCRAHGMVSPGFVSFTNCVFRNNTSAYRGGGFCGGWDSVARGELVNCVVTNNSTLRQGGGVLLRDVAQGQASDFSFLMRNCLVAMNWTTKTGSSGGEGAGVYFVANTNIFLDSCTIVSNCTRQSSGAGIYHRWGGTVTNCVIAFNVCGSALEEGHSWCLGGDTLVASAYQNCCVWPAAVDAFLAENGCVNSDPCFVDAANGDFTIRPKSPCRDSGFVEDWMIGGCDIVGNPRIFGNGVDMGCYERYNFPGFAIIFR